VRASWRRCVRPPFSAAPSASTKRDRSDWSRASSSEGRGARGTSARRWKRRIHRR
jgi:hypothetical protein